MSEKWNATVSYEFVENIDPITHAETHAVLATWWAEALRKFKEANPDLVITPTMNFSNGRPNAEPLAPAGTNGQTSGRGRQPGSKNKPKMQVPVQPLAGAIENDE